MRRPLAIMKSVKILGIETSCDETAAAIVENGVKVLSNVVASSQELHQKTGGIVPEVAAREQVRCILPVIEEVLHQAGSEPATVDALAVTIGPGLVGSLLVGVETAKVLSYVWQKSLVPVNHLIGHIYGNFVTETQISKFKAQSRNSNLKTGKTHVSFPAVVLIVSGGHTELVLMKGHGEFKWLGGTRDDAAGEAFDKVAKMLELGYPGGPAIQKTAESGDPKAFDLPRPLLESDDFDFSFSGLKTAVLRTIKISIGSNFPTSNLKPLTSNLAASFQQAVIDVLIKKTIQAAQKYQVKSVLLAGGVAANQKLRETMELAIKENLTSTVYLQPAIKYCTDNAVIIASAAYFNFKNWQLDPNNPKDLKKIFTLCPNPNLRI